MLLQLWGPDGACSGRPRLRARRSTQGRQRRLSTWKAGWPRKQNGPCPCAFSHGTEMRFPKYQPPGSLIQEHDHGVLRTGRKQAPNQLRKAEEGSGTFWVLSQRAEEFHPCSRSRVLDAPQPALQPWARYQAPGCLGCRIGVTIIFIPLQSLRGRLEESHESTHTEAKKSA